MSPSLTVSVALCTYNGAEFLEDQLRSILAQTSPVDQIVVADDGSSDATLRIVEHVLATPGAPEHVVLTGGERHGVSANFERAIAATSGDLVALSDQDDVWHAAKIERMRAIFEEREGVLLAFSDADLIDATGVSTGGGLFSQLEVTDESLERIESGQAFPELLRRNIVTGATVVFRRGLVDAAFPFPQYWVHDEWLAIVAAALGDVTPVRQELIGYRQHGSNQIGVAAPTLRRKVARVLAPRGDRNTRLWRRAEILRERLEQLGPLASRADSQLLDGKIRHERVRALLPDNRLRRVVPVLREATTGSYSRFASRGSADIVRDLLQPR